MSSILDKLNQADFSKETDFKNELYARLFGQKARTGSGQNKVLGGATKFRTLSFEELEMVNAAGEIHAQQAAKEKSEKSEI